MSIGSTGAVEGRAGRDGNGRLGRAAAGMSAGRWGTTTRGGQQCVWLSVRIVLASRRHQEDVELAARLRDALPVACDVRSPADRRALVQGAINRFGQIDILVNNAGVAYAGGKLVVARA